ncbi:MAG: HIRAN domain-containing protein [Acidimicrobiales bacterium]
MDFPGAPNENTGLIHHSADYEPEPGDDEFDAAVETLFGDKAEFGFYTHVAGTSFRNDDGTKRSDVISSCGTGEALLLDPEPDNPYDPSAVAISREDGGKLGYLPGRTAGELLRMWRLHGCVALVFFRCPTHHPETQKVVGARILLLYMKPEGGAGE